MKIKVGDKVKLSKPALNDLPYWARKSLDVVLVVTEVNADKISAYELNSKNGIRGELVRNFIKVG